MFLTSVGIGLDFEVAAALLGVRVVERVRASWIVAALGVGLGSRGRIAVQLSVEARRRPEHVVVCVEDVFLSDVVDGKLFITFTECSSAASLGISADWCSAASVPSKFVLDELADAHFSVGHSRAFLAVLVLLADRIEIIDWRTVARVGHWTIAEDETLAAVRPVLSLVEVRVVVLHLSSELLVPTGVLGRVRLPTGSGERRISRGRREKKEGTGVLHFAVSVIGSI